MSNSMRAGEVQKNTATTDTKSDAKETKQDVGTLFAEFNLDLANVTTQYDNNKPHYRKHIAKYAYEPWMQDFIQFQTELKDRSVKELTFKDLYRLHNLTNRSGLSDEGRLAIGHLANSYHTTLHGIGNSMNQNGIEPTDENWKLLCQVPRHVLSTSDAVINLELFLYNLKVFKPEYKKLKQEDFISGGKIARLCCNRVFGFDQKDEKLCFNYLHANFDFITKLEQLAHKLCLPRDRAGKFFKDHPQDNRDTPKFTFDEIVKNIDRLLKELPDPPKHYSKTQYKDLNERLRQMGLSGDNAIAYNNRG